MSAYTLEHVDSKGNTYQRTWHPTLREHDGSGRSLESALLDYVDTQGAHRLSCRIIRQSDNANVTEEICALLGIKNTTPHPGPERPSGPAEIVNLIG